MKRKCLKGVINFPCMHARMSMTKEVKICGGPFYVPKHCRNNIIWQKRRQYHCPKCLFDRSKKGLILRQTSSDTNAAIYNILTICQRLFRWRTLEFVEDLTWIRASYFYDQSEKKRKNGGEMNVFLEKKRFVIYFQVPQPSKASSAFSEGCSFVHLSHSINHRCRLFLSDFSNEKIYDCAIPFFTKTV